jgi:predicted ferric reductase
MKAQPNRSHPLEALIRPALIILLVGFIFSVMLALIAYGGAVSGASFAQKTNALFGLDSTQIWWYVTRAAGLTGYFLLWLSMAWGLAIPSRIAQPVLEGTFTYDFHEYLSLLGLGFVLLHIVVLLFDKYLPFSILQLLIPFIESYRPFWVGLGIIGFYIFLVVTVTFYLREQMGTRAFRAVHVFSLLGYLGATLHGLFAGTDSSLPATMLLYAGTFLVIVFLTVYWLVMRRPEKVAVAAPVRTTNRKPHRHR